VLRPVEDLLGRVRSGDRNAPRPIDLDLVLYDSREARDEDIVLPDPEIGRRPFLAGPLAELAPGYVLPGETRTLREIAGSLPRDGMEPLLDFTERLRRDLDAARHAEHGAD
jgi:dihydroneopterin aldolase/2-amino-4-hydroxy-6-hydroxymethyldihydropteridine diphosphokinase